MHKICIISSCLGVGISREFLITEFQQCMLYREDVDITISYISHVYKGCNLYTKYRKCIVLPVYQGKHPLKTCVFVGYQPKCCLSLKLGNPISYQKLEQTFGDWVSGIPETQTLQVSLPLFDLN